MTIATLWKNIASLGVVQIFNFALTLVLLPYLTRTLGISNWGSIVFVQIVINYLIWVTNWGFYLGATKNISSNRNDHQSISRIFISTWFAQWCLTIVIVIVLAIGVAIVPYLAEKKDLYIAASGLIIGNALMPLWFLNGLEKIKESAFIQIAIKIIALPMIIMFVKKTDDVLAYLWINSIASMVGGFLVVIWIYYSRFIKLVFPKLSEIKEVIISDSHFFGSALIANLNASIVPTMLGIYGGTSELGYYNLADRVRGAATSILNPITHALFPRMCYLFAKDKRTAMHFLKYSVIALSLMSLPISLVIYFYSDEIILLLGGHVFESASYTLKIMAFCSVFTVLSSFIVHQILIPIGASKGYAIAVIGVLILNVLFVYPVISAYGANGGAAMVLGIEVITMIILYAYVHFKKLI